MQPSEEQQSKNIPYVEDEINLIDIVKVIIKRKKLIVGGTLLCIIIAVITSFLLPKVYKVSFVADIGQIQRGDKMEPLEEPGNLKSKIEMGYSYMAMRKLNIEEDEFPDIYVNNPKNTKLLEIYLKTDEIDTGKKILSEMKGFLLKDHDRIVSQYRIDLENSIKKIDISMSALEDEKKVLQEKVKIHKTNVENTKAQMEKVKQRIDDLSREKKKVNTRANSDNTLSLLVFTSEVQENQRYYNQLQDKLDSSLAMEEPILQDAIRDKDREKKKLELEKANIESKLAALQETRVIKEPSHLEKPIFPKKSLFAVISLITGLMFFIFLAFFMEFLEKNRAELKKETSSA